jgi:N-methylhydantoinase A
VDVGGTFTDAVLDDDAGTVLAAKSPSTPPDYSRGVLDVLELLAEQLGRPLRRCWPTPTTSPTAPRRR